jgi:hypothetical protein
VMITQATDGVLYWAVLSSQVMIPTQLAWAPRPQNLYSYSSEPPLPIGEKQRLVLLVAPQLR